MANFFEIEGLEKKKLKGDIKEDMREDVEREVRLENDVQQMRNDIYDIKEKLESLCDYLMEDKNESYD